MTALVLTTLVALTLGAQPPGRVKYVADKGDVTFDHQLHTGRRERCQSCHGQGPARKIELDKKSAHALCVGCHLQKGVGPKACTACHDNS